MIRIKKRNGNLEHLDISKIQKQTADATKDLDFVSQSELELDAHIQFRDGMSSEEIQNTLIQTAVQKIDIDRPQWTFTAARLFLYDLYHKVGKLLEGTKGNPYCHLTKYIEYGESVGRIIPGLDKLYDMERLNSAIVPERDFLFNYLGIKTLFDRYLLKNEKKECFELPQQMFMGIAMFLAQNEGNGDIQARTDKAIEFYDVVSKFEVMLATPTLSNARTNRHQMSSCFIGATPDNIEGIFDGYKEMALLSKFGGGIGWDWNSVRGIASFIDGHKGAAGGTVPFLKITNDIAIAVDQLGCVERNTFVQILKDNKVKIIRISDCQIGDEILSFNIETGEKEFKKISMLHEPIVKKENQIRITFSDRDSYVTSSWHPTLVKRNDKFVYVRADEVKLRDLTVDSFGKIVSVIDIDTNPDVDENYFDLTVEGNNNYFCSENGRHYHVVHNTRKGAIAVYLEPWHKDIVDFLDIKKNSGEERRRTHDLFPALWIPDLFMRRVAENKTMSLFSPDDVPELEGLYGEAFDKRYEEYERDASVPRDEISAQELWKRALTSYNEVGSPFLCWKDTANRTNPNSHVGTIRSSNLCTEIFQNTKPNEYKVRIKFEDDSILILGENDIIKVDSGLMKLGKKVSSLDSIDGKKVYIVEKEKIDGETAVCNLASVNLSKINTKEDFERVVKTGVRMLDNVIDLNFYPVEKTKRTNMKSRAIGFGVMGEAQMLAEKGIVWGSEEHFKCIDEIMEIFSYNVINSSADLARERGNYKTFEGSKWQQGIFPIDIANENAKKLVQRDNIYDWEALREKVKGGIRNGYLMAIAPTSSISILVGTTQAIEPVYRRKWFEENLSGLIPVVAPNLSPETWNCYIPAFDVDQINVIKAAAIRQKWIDQGQSTNIFLSSDIITGKLLHQIYVSAWKYGCKSTYYLRSESPDAKKAEMSVADRSIECEGCQ